MSIFQTDFSEFPAGAKPTGWTTGVDADINTAVSDEDWTVTADAGATGGQLLRFSDAVQTEHFIAWPDVPSTEHQRAQMRWRPQGQNGSDLRMYCRADYSVAPNSSSGYTLGVRSADLDINKYTAGSFSNFNNDAGGYTAQNGVWYLTECEVVGINPTTLRVKTWPESGTKPSTWSELGGGPDGAINDTDATDIEVGGFALFALVPDDVDIDWLVVTTAGEDPEFVAGTTPTITDINTNDEVTPGTTATLTGTNLTGATGFNIGSEAQSAFTVVSDTSVTFTTVRGGNPYNQNLTGTLLHPDGNQTITVQQVPESGTFAVTAASPNTTDDASLWTGLIDTATGDPVTVVDNDQFWVNSPIPGLAIQPDGTITADETGTFTGQFWLASEGVWGSDQTVSFTLPSAPGVARGLKRALAVTSMKRTLRRAL